MPLKSWKFGDQLFDQRKFYHLDLVWFHMEWVRVTFLRIKCELAAYYLYMYIHKFPWKQQITRKYICTYINYVVIYVCWTMRSHGKLSTLKIIWFELFSCSNYNVCIYSFIILSYCKAYISWVQISYYQFY